MEIVLTLPNKNIPYYEESQDRPSFYSVKDKTFNRGKGVLEYYVKGGNMKGNFNKTSFKNATVNIRMDDMVNIEELRQKNHIRITVGNFDYFYFIKDTKIKNTNTLELNLIIDVGLTYYDYIELTDTTQAMVHRKMEQRFIEKKISLKEEPIVKLDSDTEMGIEATTDGVFTNGTTSRTQFILEDNILFKENKTGIKTFFKPDPKDTLINHINYKTSGNGKATFSLNFYGKQLLQDSGMDYQNLTIVFSDNLTPLDINTMVKHKSDITVKLPPLNYTHVQTGDTYVSEEVELTLKLEQPRILDIGSKEFSIMFDIEETDKYKGIIAKMLYKQLSAKFNNSGTFEFKPVKDLMLVKSEIYFTEIETSEGELNFKALKGIGFVDNAVNQYVANFSNQDTQTIMDRVITREENYSENIKYSDGLGNQQKREETYAYAIITFLNSIKNEKTDLTKDDTKFGEATGPATLPFLVAPLNVDIYNKLVKIGNESVIKIVYTPFPLIQNGVGNAMTNLDTGGKYEGLPTDLKVTTLDELNLRAMKMSDGEFIETINIWKPEWTLKNIPTLTEKGNSKIEPKIYTAPHFKYVITTEGTLKELYLENIMGKDIKGVDNKSITIGVDTVITGTNVLRVGRVRNGFYNNNKDIETEAYIVESSCEMANTSNNYTNFMQNNSQTLNTSRGAIEEKGRYSRNKSIYNGVFDPIKSVLSLDPGGLIGSFTGQTTQAGDRDFEYEQGMAELNSQLKDLERNTTTVSGLSRENVLTNMMIQPAKANVKITAHWGSAQTFVHELRLPPEQEISVALRYHMEGYIINQLESFKGKEALFNIRQNFNFGKIESIKNVLLECGNEVKEGLEANFRNGMRFGNTEDSEGNKITMLDYSKENWSVNMINTMKGVK